MIERDASPQSCDSVAQLSESLGAIHPYMIADIELYNRDMCCDLREETAKVCRDLWHEEAEGSGDTELPLPVPKSAGKDYTVSQLRAELRKAQELVPRHRQVLPAGVLEAERRRHHQRREQRQRNH